VTDDQIAALKEPGGWKTSVFTRDQQAAIHFAERLTGYPGRVDEHDIDALGKHFDQEQIVELVATIATANLTNRINEGLKTPVDV
jgi:alkylhydroperoxidase family enzyme